MELADVLRQRRMCRDFEDRPVDRAVLERMLDRARRAPSAGYSQGVGFVVLTDRSDRERFWAINADEHVRRAPVVVVPVCSASMYVARYSEPDKARHGLTAEAAWAVPFWTVDASFATMALLLEVVDEGLGALFFGFSDQAAISSFRSSFGVPESWSPIGAVALGWPTSSWGSRGSAATRPRRDLSEIVHWGRW